MDKAKILLAEDDSNLGSLLKDYLEEKGFLVVWAKNGKEAYDVFTKGKFNICVFDVMMPIKDGFTLAKQIRAVESTIPIVFLTAKSLKEDALEGFKIGADDYITKPFSSDEVVARLTAILRRTENRKSKTQEQTLFTIGKFKFDYSRQILEKKGAQHKLTTKESELLKLLCLYSDTFLDRNFALKSIWNDDNYFNGRSMDVYIAKLRKYLKGDPDVELMNIHGRGFRLITKDPKG
jgi:DNA-binding response OmpR family regulator